MSIFKWLKRKTTKGPDDDLTPDIKNDEQPSGKHYRRIFPSEEPKGKGKPKNRISGQIDPAPKKD